MDVISHGLWAAAAAKTANEKVLKKPISIKWATFWGFMPDVFAFAPLFIWLFYGLISGGINYSEIPKPEEGHQMPADWSIAKLTLVLYSISHSLFIFIPVFFVIFLIYKKPQWVMCGWLFHILIDIPTHSYEFYPTPFLWPISDFKVNGFSWGHPWFLIVNYALLIIVYWILWRKNKVNLS